MPTHAGPNPSADNSIIFSYDVGDTSNSYIGEPTVNTFGTYPTDLYSWTTSGNACILSRDTIPSPVGNTPLKMITTGNDAYTGTYGSSYWNITAASSGQTWTISVWAKANQNTVGQIFHFGANSAGNIIDFNAIGISLTTEWTRYSYTRTFTDGNVVSIQTRLDGANAFQSGDIIWWDGLQVEQKPNPTQFTTGTRSATQGLLPLLGNTSLNISTVSFNSNAQIVFDGTDDYINLPTNLQSGYTQATYEFICRPTSLPGAWNYFQLYIQETSTWMALYNVGSGAFFGIDLNNGSGWFDGNGGSTTGAKTTATLTANTYYHIVYSWDGTVVRIYLNGVLQSTTSTLQASNGRQNVTTLGAGDTPRNIGARGGGNYWPGTIDVVKFYNTAISTDQVQQNYRQYKSRFNLS
jgi:hypothetical protein